MGVARGTGEMGGGVGGVREVDWVGRETRKIVKRWQPKLAFVDGFSMFTASLRALSEVCWGSERESEY